MDDLSKLKAEIDTILGEHMLDAEDVTDRIVALLATHAAEPAPVAVEGVDEEDLTAVYLHAYAKGRMDEKNDHQPRADLAPTGNTALVEALRKITLAAAMQEKDQLYPDTREGWMMAVDDIEGIAIDALSQPAAPQPTPEVDKLVARLRRFAIREGYSGVVAANQAADRIEQLEAENAELRGKVERVERLCDLVDSMGSDARHQRNAAEAALQKIADGRVDWNHKPAEEMRGIARAALTEQANIRSPVQSEMSKTVDPRKDEK